MINATQALAAGLIVGIFIGVIVTAILVDWLGDKEDATK